MYGLGFLFAGSRPIYTAGVNAMDVNLATEQVSRDLNRRIDSLELACAGLWELIKVKNGFTDDEIVEAIRKVDLLDGKEDGRVLMAGEKCPNCGRTLLSHKSPKCSWCGADLHKAPI